MSKNLEKIGTNAKIAFQNKISNKRKNKVLNYYIQLILKNQKADGISIVSSNYDFSDKLNNVKHIKM